MTARCEYYLAKQGGTQCGRLGCALHQKLPTAAIRVQNNTARFLPIFVSTGGADAYEAYVNSDLTPAEAVEVLCYIYTAEHLAALFARYNLRSRARKQENAERIVKTLENLRTGFGQRPRALALLRKLQLNFRRSRQPHTKTAPTNDSDPFSCESLADIPKTEIFSYKDAHGHVYAFHATELDYAIRTLGPVNPYTREQIPEHDLARLDALMQFIERRPTPDPRSLWRTPADAYTYVLYYYEVEGFRFDVSWFTSLKRANIITIFYGFHAIVSNVERYFDLDAIHHACYTETDPACCHFALASEMLNLVRAADEPRRFYLLCNLCLVFAQVMPMVRRTIPHWVLLSAVSTPPA